jgi:hypothetical protein
VTVSQRKCEALVKVVVGGYAVGNRLRVAQKNITADFGNRNATSSYGNYVCEQALGRRAMSA